MANKSKGRMCVVAGCSNRPSDMVSVHVFPQDERQRAAWTRFVRLTRAKWTGPSPYTVVCSAHFTDTCFEAQFALMKEFGIPAKKRLCPGAVPSIYPKRKVDDLNLAFLSTPEPKPKQRPAAVKREKNRILSELLSENKTTSEAVTEDRMEAPEKESFAVDIPEPLETAAETEKMVTSTGCQTATTGKRSVKIQVAAKQKEKVADMIPSTQFSGDGKNISLQLEVDEGAESVDDDSSNDSYHDPASEEEDDIKQEPEFMDCTPQYDDSPYQKGDEVFPLSTSEWTDSVGDHLSQTTPLVKQEPIDNGEDDNSVTQSVKTTQTKTVYHCTQLTSSDTVSHPVMSDTNVGVVKQELTDKDEYENSVTKIEATSERTVSHHHSLLVSSVAPASFSVMSSNIVTSSGALALQPGPEPQSMFSILPGDSVAQIPCSVVQNPVVVGAPTLLPVTPAIAQTINLATSGKGVPPQVLNVIRRGNSLILESASASTVTPNLLNPLSTFAHPPGLNLQSDSNQPPTIPVAANISNVDHGGSVALQPMMVPVSGVELSSRGQQVSMSPESPSVMDPVTTAAKQETPSTNTSTGSYNRGADDKQIDEGCKQMDEKMFNQNRKLEAHMRTHTGEEPYECDVCWKARNLQKPYRCGVCHTGRLKRHKRTHTGEKLNECDVCGKAFNTKSNLQTHMRIHTGEKPFRCDVCGKAFIHTGNLQIHMRIHTGVKPYQCDVCEKTFSQAETLQVHSRIHTGVKPYKCDVCGKAFNRTGTLQRHMRIHTGDKPYQCDVCGKAFNQKETLQKHKRMHTGDKPYQCDVCGKAFSQTGYLQKHMRIHTGEKPYQCDVCRKAFISKVHIQRHMRTHTSDKPYKCDVCGKGLSDTGYLQKHMRIHTGEKPYKCDVCGKAFSQSGNLQNHMRVHTGEKPHTCDICWKAFISNEHLQTHMRTHTDDKPCKCDVCGKTFSLSGNLQKHKRIHTGDKPYKCDVCGKAFSQNGTLQRHMKIHTGEKPYKCYICGKAFIQNEHLQSHRRIHTGDKPYKCDVCGKAFSHTGNLQTHMRIHTGEC